MTSLTLYDYYRSSASYRVRIALNLKGVEVDQVTVNLVSGEQVSEDHLAINPQGLVPSLIVDHEVLTQSLAIIEYIDECYPNPPLLPQNPLMRARHRALALAIAADTHPVQNLRVLKFLETKFSASQQDKESWVQHFIFIGLEGFSNLLANLPPTAFASGERPGLVDCCLIPQLYNGRRWGVDLSSFSRLTEIESRCLALEAFSLASPEHQIGT